MVKKRCWDSNGGTVIVEKAWWDGFGGRKKGASKKENKNSFVEARTP